MHISVAANKVVTAIDTIFGRSERPGIFTRRRIACFVVRESAFVIGLEKAAFWRCPILMGLINSVPAERF